MSSGCGDDGLSKTVVFVLRLSDVLSCVTVIAVVSSSCGCGAYVTEIYVYAYSMCLFMCVCVIVVIQVTMCFGDRSVVMPIILLSVVFHLVMLVNIILEQDMSCVNLG